jgi:hypothetical protein
MDNLKMIGRYAITGGVAWMAGKGWLSTSLAGPLTDLALQIGAALLAAAPPLYAAWKIRNDPK